MSAWKAREDLGTSMIAKIHDHLRIPDHWRCDQGRGFSWWASDYGQTIWCAVGLFHNQATLYRLHCEIELFHAGGHAAECELPLTQAMRDATLSAITYDSERDTYKLHCSAYAHYDNEEWLDRVFLGAVVLQLTYAEKHAARLASELKATPAPSAHPTHGMRSDRDPILQADQTFFGPAGAQPSKWIGSSEWQDADDRIFRISRSSETDKTGSLTADFDWCGGEGRPIHLEVRTDSPHPELGNGLSIDLQAPVRLPPGHQAHMALHLNELERREWNWCNDLGSWCCEGNCLAFRCFVPNLCHAKGALPDLVHEMGRRAAWVNEQFEMGHVKLPASE